MAIYKCKMCSGELDINEGVTVVECEYCGTKQTVPTAKDENLHSLFNRANTLRIKGEFDKAEKLYEKIIGADETQAEAYWGLILCKYGIEYVEDPATFKRVPTCHRASFDSIVADDDYKTALKYADGVQRGIYESEAVEIDRIQKEILALSQKEEPYDVFICYKETDETGKRTQDSVIANDIYYQLTQEGFKVFYAAITLEDKLGSAYEPCIFAALNSAKVMLAIGTKPEYFNAVWVKNEWSRYLKLMKNDRSKILIPCYRDMDAYELPEEFSHLQAQDMSKIGFINDVVRGIKKVLVKDEAVVTNTETVITESAGNIAPLLERAFMFLEDGDFASADEYCEKVLDIDPKCAMAYLGKLMADLKVNKQDDLKNCAEPFDKNNNYQKILRFGDDKLIEALNGYITIINERNYTNKMDELYNEAMNKKKTAKTENEFRSAAHIFGEISGWKDADLQADDCCKNAELIEYNAKLEKYNTACNAMDIHLFGYVDNKINSIKVAINNFEKILDFKDSKEKIAECDKLLSELSAEQKRIEAENQQKLEDEKAKKEAQRKKRKKILFIGGIAVCILSIVIFTIVQIINYSNIKYLSQFIVDENRISAGEYHTVGLKSDGTVVATGSKVSGQCDVSEWTDIIAVSAGEYHTAGLKSDGTVVATGDNVSGQCDVSEWTDIVAVSAGEYHTAGLKSDGTVVATGKNDEGQCNVSGWTDIVAISAGSYHTVGLKSDGTVVATGENDKGQCNVSGWTDIVAISAGSYHTVGLKSDGTVVATGNNIFGQCDVSEWTDIVAVSAGDEHTVGLKSDGTVVATGDNYNGECDVSEWTDIIAVSAGECHTVGLKSDGTVVATGGNGEGQCVVSEWDLF